MRKILFLTVILALLLPATISSRNLFEIGLGVTGIYDTSEASEFQSFFDNMGNGDNWTIGVALSSRLSIVNLSLLAIVPNGSGVEQEAFSLKSSLSFDIPLVTNRLYLSAGAGLSTQFAYGDSEDANARVNGRAVSDTSLKEAVATSHIHLRAGLDLLLGTAKLGMFYLMETTATAQGLLDGNLADIFRTNGDNRLALMVQLALF